MMMMMMMFVRLLLFRLIIIGRWYLYLLLRFKMSTLPINVLCAHVFIFARLYSRTHLKQNVLSTHHQISVFAFVAFVMDVMQSVRVHVVMMDFWRVERTWKLNERSEKYRKEKEQEQDEREYEQRRVDAFLFFFVVVFSFSLFVFHFPVVTASYLFTFYFHFIHFKVTTFPGYLFSLNIARFCDIVSRKERIKREE